MAGSALRWQNSCLLDLRTTRSRRVTDLDREAITRTFDITADGRRIVFDRGREESHMMLIDLSGSLPI